MLAFVVGIATAVISFPSLRCVFRTLLRMGEWKVQVSFRVCEALRRELEEAALRERRTLGNFGRLLVEWAFERHKEAGSTEKLLRFKIRKNGT
jgi:hypothetical protein